MAWHSLQIIDQLSAGPDNTLERQNTPSSKNNPTNRQGKNETKTVKEKSVKYNACHQQLNIFSFYFVYVLCACLECTIRWW